MEKTDKITVRKSPVWSGQWRVLTPGFVLFALVFWSASNFGWRHSALFVIGTLLGVTLYVTAFGFTAGYRRALLHRDLGAIYAQLLMLAVAMVLFAPVLAGGSLLGRGVTGAYAPVGLQVVVGAFMFGIGMQLGGGCGSGTLYSAGGGSTRTLVTLVAFGAGGFWASLQMDIWSRLPSIPSVVIGDRLGWPVAIALQLGFLLAIGLALRTWHRRPHVDTAQLGDSDPNTRRVRRLTPARLLLGGGVALAILNFATLLLAGHPWTITWGYTLWAAKLANAGGWNPSVSTFWGGGFPATALAGSALRDVTSLMDVGILLGAMGAAAAAGRFRPKLRIPLRSLPGAVIGGVLLGYGSRIAFGCNIGAFFSGVASTSLHGWVWIAAAIPGTVLGVWMRPWFGLENEAPPCSI
ncbi:MAG: YeeE/YedE family protein [Gemmatimonadota bacterium]